MRLNLIFIIINVEMYINLFYIHLFDENIIHGGRIFRT